MTVGRYPVQPILDRLRASVPALKLIETAANLRTALEQQPAAVPAAYVVTARSGREPKGATGGMLIQGVDVGVQVVLMVRNYAQAQTGASAAADMDALITAVDTALINWSPSQDFVPLYLGPGQDAPYGSGLLITHQTYRSRYRIQAARLP